MAEHSSIEWTDATWNPVTGCSVVSPGCTNCYAMKLAGTRLQHHPSRAGLTVDSKAGPVWNGQVRLNSEWLDQPLRWKRPRRIFVCAHGDLFHESVADEWIDQVFAVMALAPQHTFQVLTKRARRMREYVSDPATQRRVYDLVCDLTLSAELQVVLIADPTQEPFAPPGPRVRLGIWPLPNVWLGVSAEDQARAEERIPELLATPAAVRFVSAEPLLGPIDLRCLDIDGDAQVDALEALTWKEIWDSQWSPEATGVDPAEAIEGFLDWYNLAEMPEGLAHPALDWVIVGGESGPGARPMQPECAESIRDQCAAAGVAFFFKQWGSHKPTSDCNGRYMIPGSKKEAGRLLGGVEHNGMPEVRS